MLMSMLILPTRRKVLLGAAALAALVIIQRAPATLLVDGMLFEGVGTCSESTAFLNRTTGLNAAHIDAYNNLICGLVTDGIFAKLDMLQVYATQDSTTALLNLVQNDFNATSHGSPTFVADRGYTGTEASTTVYIDTGYYVRNSPVTLYRRNAAHLSSWQVTNGQGTASFGFFYTITGINSYVFPRFTDDKLYLRINVSNASATNVANTDSRGHFISNRSGATANEEYLNGVSVLTGAEASLDPPIIPQVNMYSLGWNSSGTAHGYGQQQAMVSGGDSLNATQAGNFYTRLRTYMTAVGVP